MVKNRIGLGAVRGCYRAAVEEPLVAGNVGHGGQAHGVRFAAGVAASGHEVNVRRIVDVNFIAYPLAAKLIDCGSKIGASGNDRDACPGFPGVPLVVVGGVRAVHAEGGGGVFTNKTRRHTGNHDRGHGVHRHRERPLRGGAASRVVRHRHREIVGAYRQKVALVLAELNLRTRAAIRPLVGVVGAALHHQEHIVTVADRVVVFKKRHRLPKLVVLHRLDDAVWLPENIHSGGRRGVGTARRIGQSDGVNP